MKNIIKTKDIVKLVNSLHDAADKYQRTGYTPTEFIKAIDSNLDKEMDAYKAIDPGIYNFEEITWGEACSFILIHGDKYKDFLRLATSEFDEKDRLH